MFENKRKIHTIIRKYNQFNSRFGDEQFNIKITPYCNGNFEDFELYSVKCGSDVELETSEISELFDYILGEVDYYQYNLSQSEGWLYDILEHDLEERKIFNQSIRYLRNNCKE